MRRIPLFICYIRIKEQACLCVVITCCHTKYGALRKGKILCGSQYLDALPNFKAYLEQNPIVRLSITGDTTTGAIYFSPYFDGVNDIERMPLMRVD